MVNVSATSSPKPSPGACGLAKACPNEMPGVLACAFAPLLRVLTIVAGLFDIADGGFWLLHR